MDENETALAGTGALSAFGLLTGGVAGLAFLTEPVAVPLWFVLALTVVPTGTTLKILRSKLKQYGGN